MQWTKRQRDSKDPHENKNQPSSSEKRYRISTHKQKQTTVTNIIWNISKDGLLKPIVEINPVNIGNTLIQKVTGNNGRFIDTNKIN